jgi:3',5'-cyclic AMP phosphodiesterase CpdA
MRIAHFSDLHILDLGGVSPHRFLNKRMTGYATLRLKRGHIHHPRFVRAIAQEIRRSRADHVVITGDLTNLALDEEFAAARRLLDDELGLPASDVSIVPGNHDIYTRGALRAKRFVKYFGQNMTSDLPELGVEIPLGRFPFVRLRGPVAIIGLTSAVPRLPLLAAGRIGKPQAGALVRILAHPEVKKRTPVVLMHHPAHNPASRVKRLLRGLEDAALLWTSIQDVPRGLVLHGHLHERILRNMDTSAGQMLSVGATSASLEHTHEGKMAGFNLYEITDTGAVGRIEAHVLNPRGDAFEISSVPRLME